MTYLNYVEVFDKAIIVDPIFKKLDRRLALTGKTWNVRQLFEVKCYAQDARDFFKDILLESLNTFEDYQVDERSYPPITTIHPFTEPFGDPFLAVVQEPNLESVEKLVCLILFSEHIIAFCDSCFPSHKGNTDTEDEDEEDEDFRMEFVQNFEDSDTSCSDDDGLRIDIEPLMEGITLHSPTSIGASDNLERGIEEMLKLVASKDGSALSAMT
ncbi:hypothetical protein CC2G_006918 [Coprinopsis cinerea AmutBmut pab1-1]|nr:hypothetical protein CC2G_006918 [Coprinopsis cinerea AmutBmut pab1-1]